MISTLLTLTLGQETNKGVLDRLRALNPVDVATPANEPEVEDLSTVLARHEELGLPGNPCGGSMYIQNVGPTTDDQVLGINGDWMAGCNACGNFLATYRVNGFCEGWYCEIGYFGPIATGVWLKRNGGPCSPVPPPVDPACRPISDSVGYWAPIASTSEKFSYKVTKGVTRSTTEENSQTWGVAAEASVSAGFKIPSGPGVDVSIKTSVSASIGHNYQEYFSMTETTEFTFEADRAGQMWQWQFEFHDACGTNIVRGMDVVLTNNRAEVPCCLPGHYQDPSRPESSSCVASYGETAIYNLCKHSEVLL